MIFGWLVSSSLFLVIVVGIVMLFGLVLVSIMMLLLWKVSICLGRFLS